MLDLEAPKFRGGWTALRPRLYDDALPLCLAKNPSKIPSKISGEKGHYGPIPDGLTNRISPARGHNPKLTGRSRSDSRMLDFGVQLQSPSLGHQGPGKAIRDLGQRDANLERRDVGVELDRDDVEVGWAFVERDADTQCAGLLIKCPVCPKRH